jgi:predicted ATPase
MYIKRVSIRNIRSIRILNWEVEPNECAGWHVFIGDNASGKSTVLRAIALGLVGHQNAEGLREVWSDWLTINERSGTIELDFEFASPSGQRPLFFDEKYYKEVVKFDYDETSPSGVRLTGDSAEFRFRKKIKSRDWFSVAFGPYRRFNAGRTENNRLFRSNRELAAHLTVFEEDVALTEALDWLKELNYKHLEGNFEGELLDDITRFINQDGFLPHNTKLSKVSSSGVEFVDPNGQRVMVESLSDGFRSMLSMTFEIIRQLQISFPKGGFFSQDRTQITYPGVVLIDEIDAHLHPTWQRQIGFWLRDHFPKMQFIVTTHSPLVCQAADKGSVWKLPTPSTDEVCRRVTGQELNRLLYGNIIEAYSTNLFGLTTTRSEEGKDKLQRLAELNLKEVLEGLDEDERAEQTQLRETMPTVANSALSDQEP